MDISIDDRGRGTTTPPAMDRPRGRTRCPFAGPKASRVTNGDRFDLTTVDRAIGPPQIADLCGGTALTSAPWAPVALAPARSGAVLTADHRLRSASGVAAAGGRLEAMAVLRVELAAGLHASTQLAAQAELTS